MSKSLIFLVIFLICFNLIKSSPTTTTPDELSTPQTSEVKDEETQNIFTGSFYEVIMTVGGDFHEDLKYQNSKRFIKFSEDLEAELIYVIENAFDIQNVPLKTFVVKNILPSNLKGFLYILLVAKVDENYAESWMEEIKKIIEEKGALLETKLDLQGFSWSKISEKEVETLNIHFECESDFCTNFSTSTEEPPKTSSTSSTTCSPHEEIQRGKTSIYIFEDPTCVNHVKGCASGASFSSLNEVRKTSKRSCGVDFNQSNDNSAHNSDDMASDASSTHENILMADDEEEMTVVVVKKKGNKVFIEI